MITYNDLYECIRKEKYSEQLQPLPKKFISEVANYITEKKKSANQKEDLFSEEIMKSKKQLENSISIFNELMLIRKKKLLGLAFVASETGISKSDFENMLDFEKELFDNIIESVKNSEKKFSLQFNRDKKTNSEGSHLSLVLFLDDIGEFVGLDGETLGPFAKGELANIPKKISEILISDKKAELIEED